MCWRITSKLRKSPDFTEAPTHNSPSLPGRNGLNSARAPGAAQGAVRSALADRGDNGQTPRHTLFFFYRGNLEGLAAVATKAGYEVQPTANREGVVLETTIAVDEDSFEPYTQQMQEWADEFGCDYDGRECKVVNQ